MPHSKNRILFPHGGILSCLVELKDGAAIETGMIGDDGVFGVMQAIDGRLSLNKVIVQVPGRASVIDAAAVRHLANASPDFRSLIVKYEQFLMGQVQQTTAAMLFPLKHAPASGSFACMTSLETICRSPKQMMGVQRTSVSGVAIRLQDEGLIEYHRGKVRIDAVQGQACECHEAVREHYLAVFGKVSIETFPDASGLEQAV